MEERQFNEQQQTVIRAQGGYHLVLAPPGCGKTAVLAERVVWARQQGVPFSDMACLTFTNRAARGMRERIEQRLGWQISGGGDLQSPTFGSNDLDQLFVGNVHRFCSHFLFDSGTVPEHAAVIDTDTSMSIMADFFGEDELRILGDTKERQRYSQVINLQHLLYQCEHRYPRSLIVHRDALPPMLLKELCLAFSLPYTQDSTIELYRHADQYLDQPALLSRDARQMLQQMRVAWQYADYKQRNDLIDFEDLLLYTYEAMSNKREPITNNRETITNKRETITNNREAITNKHEAIHLYSWIQVDEVQDLNPLQLAIIDLFTNNRETIDNNHETINNKRLDSSTPTVVYLGDAQQAIFSFMGAQTNMLDALYHRCGDDHFYNFHVNYRSPKYLLDVFNGYAEHLLGISSDLLPSTTDHTPRHPGDLLIMEADTSVDEANMVAREVERIYTQCPDETIAVVVAFNSDADEVSDALVGIPHFKVSGTDVFSTTTMRTLLAHLSVVNMEHNFIAWSQMLTGIRLYSSASSSRQFVRAMMELALTPVDLLDYHGHSTYLAEFVHDYETRDIVVFDTETTGLDVFSDDVVQLAAIKVRRGRVVDSLDLYIETNREIPPMLGEVVNPLVEEYGRHPHLSHSEALEQFTTFARGCAILGHNATYDYHIMENNMRRYAPHLSMSSNWPTYLDTLKLARLLHPRQRSYKLKDLLSQLGLEGENSHLASDDIVATQSLMVHCYDRARSIIGRQHEFLSRHRKTVDRFCLLYADIYHDACNRLYVEADGPLLARELSHAHGELQRVARLEALPKLPYIARYIELDLLTPSSGRSLGQQLAAHIQDLTTLKEADLCGAQSMTERVFVSTVHKAKGLEFDHVIVYDAVEGKFPSSYANTRAGGAAEEARKFYVAISRARRRLIVSFCRQGITSWGRSYPRQPSPYLAAIKDFFR